MAEKTLNDLVHHALKDLYFAEHQILKALPKIIEAAQDKKLKAALTHHKTETEGHVKRLEKGFASIGEKPSTTPCEAIKGILKEGDEIIGDFGKAPIGDAAIIFACQAVEHYEINRYGTLHAWAIEMGHKELAGLMAETLAEEYGADDTLTDLAVGGLNEVDAIASREKTRSKHRSSKKAA